MVLLFIRAPFYVLLVFIAMCAVFWLFWLSYQYLPSDWLERPLLGRCKQKQCGLRGLLCRWPSITEWEMYITALRAAVSEMTYTVLSGTLNSTILYHTIPYDTFETLLYS